jgi:hypothetical protein
MSPEYVTPPVNGDAYANFIIGTNAGTATGRFVITFKGSSGNLEHTTQVELIINSAMPTISGYTWNTPPKANQSFGGTITGTNFAGGGGTQVWFCVSGTSTCYQHTGVNVSNSTSLTISNVNLGAGAWQFYVKTAAGQSARSAAFTVQSAVPQPPTVTGYSWNTTPTGSQTFGGTIRGTGFVSGNTQVWFCKSGTSTCYQQPAAGVSVSGSTSLVVSNVVLSSGTWQFYVKTSAGQSARSTTFTVR